MEFDIVLIKMLLVVAIMLIVFLPNAAKAGLKSGSLDPIVQQLQTMGNCNLSYSDDSGCSVNTQELSRAANGNTGTLAIGLNLVQNVTGALTGFVPAGKWIKLLSSNILNTPTFTYRSGQEVLM